MPNRARITYIHQHFRLPSEGGGTRPWEFAKRLVADGHSVTMICGGDADETLTIDGLRIIRLRSSYRNGMNAYQRLRAFMEFMVKATWHASAEKADVVFASSTPLTVAVPGIIAASLRRARFVFEVRDLWPSVPARLGYLRSPLVIMLAQALERIAYNRADVIIALSPGMADGVLQTAPLADVRVIPNASDRAEFARTELERRKIRDSLGWAKKRVIYAGSFGETYRIPWLVRVAFHAHEIGFQILGDGHAMSEAHRLAKGLGMDAAALLPGSVAKTEVADRIAASEIVISSILDDPALHVNSLNKVFDALAAGRPIAFNHGGWLADLVVGAGAGWRLPTQEQEAATMLERIAQDESALHDATAEARKLAPRFDRELLYKQFREAVLGEPRSDNSVARSDKFTQVD